MPIEFTRTDGMNSRTRKVSEQDVRDIRASDEPLKVLAARYNVHETAISNIKRRLRWASVK